MDMKINMTILLKMKASSRWLFLPIFFMAATANAWMPGASSPNATTGLAVDRFDRQDVLSFYNCIYTASEGYANKINWNGSIGSCDAGTTAASFKDDVLRRVNFYRAMVGMSGDIVFNASLSSKCQEAALMMSAEGALSHSPKNSWECHTSDGADAAANSNLALGSYGAGAIDSYMVDAGSNNAPVGHRRWILYSRAQIMGTGDVPASAGQPSANALWVIGSFKPAPAPQFVAWPNDGYIPVNLVPARWSLSYPGANFSGASVTMTQGGANVPLSIVSSNASGIGENTIVWEPVGIPATVTADVPYVVTVSSIGGSGPSSFSYTVNLMNPDLLGDSVTISGMSTAPVSGQPYTFNSISGAEAYEVEIATSFSMPWVEGAEDSPIPNITDGTDAGYVLRQVGLKRTGSKAFQLTYPSGVFSDQHFVVTRNVMPSDTSRLEFYQRARFSNPPTTLKAQISDDGGASWTTLWSRNGAGLSSSNWDSNWIQQSIDISVYQNQIVHLRFLTESNGQGVVQGVGSNFGFFVDDITVTNSSYLGNAQTTQLASTAAGFTLDNTTAGKTLVAGDSFLMRVRPMLGCRWFGFGAMKEVTVVASSGYDTWVTNNFPAVTGGFSDDDDGDNIPNGVEYAFGLNPLVVNAASSLPIAQINGAFLELSYAAVPEVVGVTYGAMWSANLVDWFPVSDTGSGSHLFRISTSGHDTLFIRHVITESP